MEKKCNKCNVVKDVSEFSKEKRNRDGLAGVCKVCRKPYYEKYRENNTDKIKQYREANKGKLSAAFITAETIQIGGGQALGI